MSDFQNTPDPMGLVYGGKQGAGSAFILANAWQTGINLQRHYDDQDAQAERQQRQLDAQNKGLTNRLDAQGKIAASKLEAEQHAAAEKRRDEWSKFDPSGVMPEDMDRIATAHRAMIAQSAADSLAGRNPGNSANAVEYARMVSSQSANLAAAEASRQYNAERVKQMQTIQGAGVDKPYDVPGLTKAWEDFAKLPSEERKRVGPPRLSQVISAEKVAQFLMGDIEQAVTEDKPRLTGSGVLTHTVTDFTPEQIAIGAKGIIAYPGMKEKLEEEYTNPDNAALVKESRALNFNQYARWRAEKLAHGVKAKKEDYNQTWTRDPQLRGENHRYNRESTQQNQSATNLLTKYNQLRTGGAEQYSQPTIIGGKSYLRSDEFNNYTVGDFNGKPNQVRGIYRDKAGKMYLATDATGGQPVEMRDEDAFNKFLLPAWTGDNMKGKAEVLQSAAKKFFKPGGNTIDVSSLGNTGTPQGEEAAQDALKSNQEYVNTVQRRMSSYIMGIDPNSSATIVSKSGKIHSKSVVEAATLTRLIEKGGKLVVNGTALRNPKVVVRAGVNGGPKTLGLSYDVANKRGFVMTKVLPVTPVRLAELMKGFVPNEDRLAKPQVSRRPNAASNTAPTIGALEQATTITNQMGTSSSSSNSTGGLYKKPTGVDSGDVQAKQPVKIGNGTRFVPGLNDSNEMPTSKNGKRNILGL